MKQKIGIIGSGNVGQALGLGFAKSGHEVKIGSRDPSKLSEWLSKAGSNASVGTNNEAAAFGEIIVFCPAWSGAANALELSGKDHFNGKIVIDTTNPLKFEEGKAPSLSIGYPDSAGSTLQKWIPNAKVVKAWNSIPGHIMANPKLLTEGAPDLFICGNDALAKKTVEALAKEWGWEVVDMGDISQAAYLESLAMVVISFGITRNNWNIGPKLFKK